MHSHIDGRVEDSVSDIEKISTEVDAILLDLPEHSTAIQAVAHLLKTGARLSLLSRFKST